MTMKTVTAAVAMALTAALAVPAADAGAPKAKRGERREAVRDSDYCKPYNGPYGYYGNPWCDGGYKYAEDYPPGTGPYIDLLDIEPLRRLNIR